MNTSPVVLDPANAELAAALGMALMGSVLPLAGLAADSIRKVASRGEDRFTEACPVNGTADYVFTDVDHDGLPTDGDSISVTYEECLVSQFQQTGSGRFTLTLGRPGEPSTVEDSFYSGILDPRLLTTEIRSVVAFELHLGLLEEVHRITGDIAFQLDIQGERYSEQLIGLDAIKRADFRTARNELSVAGTIHSEILEGSLQFGALHTLSGFLNTYPDQGGMELVGASGGRVVVEPYNVPNSTVATIGLDESGSGTVDELPDRPFWSSLIPDFAWSYMPTHQQFIRPFDPDDFWFAGGSSTHEETMAVGSTLRLQFSRELDVASVPVTLNLLRSIEDPPYIEELEAETDTRGAAIVLRPVRQYRHASQYIYPTQSFTVRDRSGHSADACCGQLTTADNLSASALANPPFGLAGTTIDLDGTESVSAKGPIVAWHWSQLSGPAGQIGGADRSAATLVLPPVNGATVLRVQLQVSDDNGEFEWDTADIHAFGSVADIGLLHFDGDEDEYVSLGREWFLSRAAQAMTVEREVHNGIHLGFHPWNVYFVAPGDQAIEPGSYENARQYQTVGSDYPELSLFGDGRSCNTSTGRFDVLDVEYGPGGEVTRLAIDFEQRCDDSGKLLKGQVRVSSAIPLPPPESA